MNMNACNHDDNDNDYEQATKKHHLYPEPHSKDISRFVNQHQTDIKGLLMG